MPIFEYLCKDCGKRFEELVSRSVENTIPCPVCSSAQTEKLMSAPGGISIKSGSSCGSASLCSGPTGGCCSGGSCPHA